MAAKVTTALPGGKNPFAGRLKRVPNGPRLRAMTRCIALLAVLSLAACGGGAGPFAGGRAAPDLAVAPMADPPVADAAAAVGSAEATADPTSDDGRFLGFTVASLGDATRPGLWLETPLVSEEGPGRVVAESGMQLTLTLIPSGGDRGAGSRLSLEGFQALGLDLTSLPTLTVISDA